MKEFIQKLESVKNYVRDLVLKQNQEGYVAAENGFGGVLEAETSSVPANKHSMWLPSRAILVKI